MIISKKGICFLARTEALNRYPISQNQFILFCAKKKFPAIATITKDDIMSR